MYPYFVVVERETNRERISCYHIQKNDGEGGKTLELSLYDDGRLSILLYVGHSRPRRKKENGMMIYDIARGKINTKQSCFVHGIITMNEKKNPPKPVFCIFAVAFAHMIGPICRRHCEVVSLLCLSSKNYQSIHVKYIYIYIYRSTCVFVWSCWRWFDQS